MKKNLLRIIGALCGLATILFYNAPFLKDSYYTYRISYMMLGIGDLSVSTIFSISFIATVGVFAAAVCCIINIVKEKDSRINILITNSITLFSIIYYISVLSSYRAEYGKSVAGIGAIMFLLLSFGFFFLNFAEIFISLLKKESKEETNIKNNE